MDNAPATTVFQSAGPVPAEEIITVLYITYWYIDTEIAGSHLTTEGRKHQQVRLLLASFYSYSHGLHGRHRELWAMVWLVVCRRVPAEVPLRSCEVCYSFRRVLVSLYRIPNSVA